MTQVCQKGLSLLTHFVVEYLNMEFRRINEYTINCIITEEDMDEKGISLEDLLTRKEDALEFLHDILIRATEEVGYHPVGNVMPMQISVMPDRTLVVTLSENADAAFADVLKSLVENLGIELPKKVLQELGDTPDSERMQRLKEYLSNLKNFTSSVQKLLDTNGLGTGKNAGGPGSGNQGGFGAGNQSGFGAGSQGGFGFGSQGAFGFGQNPMDLSGTPGIQKPESLGDQPMISAARRSRIEPDKKGKGGSRLGFDEAVFGFETLRDVIDFTKSIEGRQMRMNSTLYRDGRDNCFYLYLGKGRDSDEHYARMYALAFEFGYAVPMTDARECFMKESMECMIEEKAVNKLRKL